VSSKELEEKFGQAGKYKMKLSEFAKIVVNRTNGEMTE
jgi:hypothetical protein